MATVTVPQPSQPSLLWDVQRVERPWKATTETSREAVREFEASGKAETLRRQITLSIRRLWNRTQVSPTADEIADDLFEHGVIEDRHPDHVKPRLTELSRGWIKKFKDEGGVIARVRVGGGIVEKAGKRQSRRSGLTVHTWRVIERGTGKL